MMRLRTKLWLGFGTLLLILLVVSSLSIIVFTRYSHALERVFSENYDSAVYCDSMKESLDQLNTRAQRLIWEEPAARKIDFVGSQSDFNRSLTAQLGNCTLPGEIAASRRIAQLWLQYQDHYLAFNNSQPVNSELYKKDLLPRYAELMKDAQHIADMNMSNMVSVDGQAKRTLLAVRNALLILVMAGTALAAMVVWTAGVTILRPLRDLTHSARQIEAGNLDLNLPMRSRDEVGELAEAFNSMTDRLRQFKQADHDKILRARQTTQLAIDSLPDAVFVIGPDDRIEISNDAARIYFGIEPGRNVSSLGLNWLPPLYEEVKSHGKPVEPRGYKSAIQLFVDGRERFLLPRAVPMLGPDHRQLGVTAILVDVTQLRHVDEAKSGLVSTVSHELRTPLTSQRLLLQLLISSLGPHVSASHRRMLEVAMSDNDRLSRTINDLLSISRIESGRAQFQFRPMAPREIVLASVDPLRQLFMDKELQLQIAAPDDLPLVKADPTSINSALTNLLSNALKFTPCGGCVTISAAAAGPEERAVVFCVSDGGPGIPVEFQPRIFEKFFRVPSNNGPTGAGLGLSIVKEIVEAHGGAVGFSSVAGGGCSFRFTLSLA